MMMTFIFILFLFLNSFLFVLHFLLLFYYKGTTMINKLFQKNLQQKQNKTFFHKRNNKNNIFSQSSIKQMKSMNKAVKYQSGNLILKQTEQLGPLVLGDCNSAMDKKIHKQFNIQTIISIGQQAMPIKQKLPQNCKHFFYDIHDNKSQKVSAQLFDQVNKNIEEGRKVGGVLVHCYAGVSRSSTFVIGYIMQKDLKTYDIAKQEVKSARNCIYPNDGFVHHLKNYQKVLEKRQQQRLRKLEQQKRLQIEKSLVKSARKSMRGGVKSADVSPQKVKQMAQQRKRYQFIIQPIQVIKQEKQANNKLQTKTQNLQNTQNKNINKSKLQDKRLYSKSVISNKNKIQPEGRKQQIKLPKVNTKTNSQINKQTKSQKNAQNKQKGSALSQRRNQKSILMSSNIQKNTKISNAKQIKKQQIKVQQQKPIMKESKSVLSTKKQKISVPQIDESLLNDRQKKIKKIYQTKISVK